MNAWIKDIVIGLVETYETNDVYTLCDYLNIEILITDNNKNADSYFLRNKTGDEFIFIKPELNHKEERSLLAHELGHALLHTDYGVAYYYKGSCNKGKLEIQANTFAAELLLTGIDLDDYIDFYPTIESLLEEIGIAENLIEIKLGKSC